ncbi:MAG: DUF5692 family protein [Spirochaetales bacterium]|nr:DUF5692 family protein [Spirochaetales bacterium]
MFFYTGYSFTSLMVALLVFAALVLVNEVSRRSKWAGITIYVVLPIVMSIFVWPTTAAQSSWFLWVKTYSALAGVIGFMIFRYVKKVQSNKAMILFPSFILIVNIIEAVIRDFEVSGMPADSPELLYEGLVPGPWNILNALAGIMLILSMSGFLGVKIAKTKSKDMIWPDMTWFWILAYAIWNICFCYTSVPLRSFYAGFILNITPVILALFVKRGAYLQHRASTLAIFVGTSMIFPRYDLLPAFSITASYRPEAFLTMSILSFAANAIVLGISIYTAVKSRKNPLTSDIYVNLDSQKRILVENNLA